MVNRGPMPKPGNPQSETCRHCQNARLVVRGFLLCEQCDAPKTDGGITVRPTWKPRLSS